MDIAKNLKRLINESDINLAQLSRATTVPRQTLDNWLSGQEPRSLSQVKKVADHFGVSIDEMCFGVQKMDSNIEEFKDEINAGVFEVVLRRVKK